MPTFNYKGSIIALYGKCTTPGKPSSSDIDDLDKYTCWDANVLEDEDVIENVTINDDILTIVDETNDDNNKKYIYMKEHDIYLSLNMESYNTFIKMFYIQKKCDLCNDFNFVMQYCMNDQWMCNGCILDSQEFHNYFTNKNI